MQRGRCIERPVIRPPADDVGARAAFPGFLLTFSTGFGLLSHNQSSDPHTARCGHLSLAGFCSDPSIDTVCAAQLPVTKVLRRVRSPLFDTLGLTPPGPALFEHLDARLKRGAAGPTSLASCLSAISRNAVVDHQANTTRRPS
ncbi:hypothetical protein SVAN01_08527 [Stagonosporopsis vannaccii]|nr:hypothetical protein SVAN01_08527 [Stagonosporopsis vannaccii]